MKKIPVCGVAFESINTTNCTVDKISHDRLLSILKKLGTKQKQDEEAKLGANLKVKEILKYWNDTNVEDYYIVKKHIEKTTNSQTDLFDRQWSEVAKETKLALNQKETKRHIVEEMVLGHKRTHDFQGNRNEGIYML